MTSVIPASRPPFARKSFLNGDHSDMDNSRLHSSELHQSELWEITRRLIGFDTVSVKSNIAATEYLANLLNESGFSVQLYKETIDGVEKGTVIAWAGPAAPDGLIISGHTDVVPFEGQPGWRTNPLELTSDDQSVFGRGVADMKAFLAQAIVAARQISSAKLRRPLVFIFTCDEEVAGQGSGRLIQVLPQFFQDYPLPTLALIGEPTGFEIFPAHKGYATFDVVVHGRGGHSSVPERGLNAIMYLARAILSIQQIHEDLRQYPTPENSYLFPESPCSTFNFGVIQGGLATNMIAETARLAASVRITPGDDADELLRRVREKIEREIVQPMQAIAPESSAWIENCVAIPPMQSPLAGPFPMLLSQAIGRQVERGAPFATDGGYFQQLGIQSYICGPGLLSEAHQPNESLSLEDFVGGVAKLARVIEGWCVQNR
jgi:acetylornithine deacetylase